MKDSKYDQALERAKQGLPIDEIFPELKESEDERIRKKIIEHLEMIKMGCVICTIDTSEEIAWLEKQKELDKMIVVSPEVWDNAISDAFENGKKEGEKQKEQKPAEWSEEDEKMRKNLIELLIRLSANTRTDSTSPNYSYPREIDWLKSLRPQSHWKPSEKQIKAAESAYSVLKAHDTWNEDEHLPVLMSLIDDLQKRL